MSPLISVQIYTTSNTNLAKVGVQGLEATSELTNKNFKMKGHMHSLTVTDLRHEVPVQIIGTRPFVAELTGPSPSVSHLLELNYIWVNPKSEIFKNGINMLLLI